MADSKNGILRIGTSNIVVPGTKQTYPVEFQSGSRLQYYSSLFNTLEVNGTFYKIPLPKTFWRWSNEVPENFKFTVKLWREITHVKKLLYKLADIDLFMNAANMLGNKKGCLLIQFPASITIDYFIEVEKILERLCQINSDKQWQLCVEVRHMSWYEDAVFSMLTKYKASLVIHDMPASRPSFTNPAKDVIYLRFHGPKGDYRGSYSNEFLEDYAEIIKEWLQNRKDVYVYFNNTMGSALHNAQRLQQLTL